MSDGEPLEGRACRTLDLYELIILRLRCLDLGHLGGQNTGLALYLCCLSPWMQAKLIHVHVIFALEMRYVW